MSSYSVTIYRTSYTDIADGDYVDPDTSEETIEWQPDDEHPVEWAAATIEYECGAVEPSRWPLTREHAASEWYRSADDITTDYRTGERETCSAHLKGFTDDEAYAIARILVPNACR